MVGPRGEAVRKRLGAWMEKAKITQKRMAEEIGVSQATVGDVLNGEHATNLENYEKMAQACGRTLAELVQHNDPPPSDHATLVSAWTALPKKEQRDTILTLMESMRVTTTGERLPPRRPQTNRHR